MAPDPGSIDHLSQVISQVVAPSFLLGAVASFISLLFERVDRVSERLRSFNGNPTDDHGLHTPAHRAHSETVRLRRRLKYLNRATLLAIFSGIAATLLITLAFATALLSLEHVWGAAILFMVSLTLLCASLIFFAIEVVIGFPIQDRP